MLHDDAFAALRRAATLAHALPPVRVRVSDGSNLLLEVAREHEHAGPVGDGTLRLPPCAFRVAVGQAHRLRLEGRRVGFLGLPDGATPQVQVGLPCGGEAFPGGIYQVLDAARWLHLFATALPIDACRRAVAGQEAPEGRLDRPVVHPSMDGATRVGFHRDDATEVTLVHTELPLTAADGSQAAARDLMERLLAACATEELLGSLGVPT